MNNTEENTIIKTIPVVPSLDVGSVPSLEVSTVVSSLSVGSVPSLEVSTVVPSLEVSTVVPSLDVAETEPSLSAETNICVIEEIYKRASSALLKGETNLEEYQKELLKYKISFGTAYDLDLRYLNVSGIYWLRAYNNPKVGDNLGKDMIVRKVGLLTFTTDEIDEWYNNDYTYDSDDDPTVDTPNDCIYNKKKCEPGNLCNGCFSEKYDYDDTCFIEVCSCNRNRYLD